VKRPSFPKGRWRAQLSRLGEKSRRPRSGCRRQARLVQGRASREQVEICHSVDACQIIRFFREPPRSRRKIRGRNGAGNLCFRTSRTPSIVLWRLPKCHRLFRYPAPIKYIYPQHLRYSWHRALHFAHDSDPSARAEVPVVSSGCRRPRSKICRRYSSLFSLEGSDLCFATCGARGRILCPRSPSGRSH
jgi:hypothetical protein